MSKTFQTRIKHKKDTHANWTTNNPVLLDGEIAVVVMGDGEIRQKVGNGTSSYTALDFLYNDMIIATDDVVETDIIPNDAVKYSVQSLTNAQKAQARTNINAADGSKTALKTQLYKRNLLDNSDFTNPVNQRGATNYTGTYGIDRWRTWNTDTLIKNNGYISVTGSLFQYLYPSECENKVYTLAAKKSDGTVILCSQNVLNSFSWYDNGLGLGLDGNIVVALGTGNYVWAALYEGEYTVDTLPEYQPKGYTAEKLECQRYFLKVPTDSCRYAATLGEDTNLVYFLYNTNVPMRTTPAVSGSLRFTFGYNGGAVSTSAVTLSPNGILPGGIIITATATWSTSTTALASYMAGVIATTSITDLSFSADL